MFNYSKNVNLEETSGTLVIGVSENEAREEVKTILSNLEKRKRDLYKFGEVTAFYPDNGFKVNEILFVGLGNKESYVVKDQQTIFSKVAKQVKGTITILADTFYKLNENRAELIERMVETIGLVNYKFNDYKTEQKDSDNSSYTIVSKDDVSHSIERGVINFESTNHARDLINEPRNKMNPTLMAKYAENLANRLGIDYKIYTKTEVEALGMGAFLAVNQGSKDEAKLIHLKYRGNSESTELTALVGKGVTYDSGGYSIKPKDGMPGMKGDMGGSASVFGAFEAIVRKELPVNVDLIVAATENLISNEAVVPDDVVTTMSGKTIEILNTDAEGRLTLVDAVTFANKNGATKIIDVATLTGGVIVALGHELTGVMTNDDAFLNEFKIATEQLNEPVWQLPITDHFKERVRKSNVADFNNSPGRDGHAAFAGTLIGEFVGSTPWIHLDIAGTSNRKSDYLLGPAGGTGVMVRSICRLFEK
ncbi:leucyl aminopeptidase [Haloplasma contractile]|uniref:Probable cytosol aminopeptidase n=1 Tax=Haloplasma contractile SSD-17B TaxID=1033810 RepID=U2ECJ6_9MOLU|nr:leucyl aminopeptidase [Haloplasma contractile]ERJ12486.1 putative cytosol aminopeptidase protein [Haloplasma contractile SSD-17B]